MMTRRLALVVAFALTGCSSGPSAPEGVVFPTYPLDGAVPAGIIGGIIQVDDGCIYVARGKERWLVLWPDGYEARMENGRLAVFDDQGALLVSDGENIRLGGGELRPVEMGGVSSADRAAEDFTGETIPARCGHLYWQGYSPD